MSSLDGLPHPNNLHAANLDSQAGGGNTAGQDDGGVPVLTIFFMTLWMSAMSGCGALPYFFTGKLQQSWAGIANAVACGVMLAASFDLLHEGAPCSPTLVVAGMLAGAIFVKLSQEYLEQYEDVGFDDLSGADARRALLIVGVMAAHAFGEGSGVGVSFSGRRGHAQGTLVTIAIGLHNVPEGMAVATVMMAKGGTAKRALFWSLLCSMPQALVAVPSYLFVETFQALLPLALGFAAGCMIWIVCAELLPDALEAAPHSNVATAVTFSAAWLQGLSMWIATLEQPGGHLASPIRADLGALTSHLLVLVPALVTAPCAVTVLFSLLRPQLPPRLMIATAAGAMLAMGSADLLAVTASSVGLTQGVLLGCVGGGLAALALRKPRVSQEEKSLPPSEAPTPTAAAAYPTLLPTGSHLAPVKPAPSLWSAPPAEANAGEAAAAAAALHGGAGPLGKWGLAELSGQERTWVNGFCGPVVPTAAHAGTHVIDLTGTLGRGGVGAKQAEGDLVGADLALPGVLHDGGLQGVGIMGAREGGGAAGGVPAGRSQAQVGGAPGLEWASDSVYRGGSACSRHAWCAEDLVHRGAAGGHRQGGLEEWGEGDGGYDPKISKGDGSLLGGGGGSRRLDSGVQGQDDPVSMLVRMSVGGLALLVCHAACSIGAGLARAVVLQQARAEEASTLHLLLPLVLQGLPMALVCLGLGTCWAMACAPWGLYTSSNSRAQQQGRFAAVCGAACCAATVVLVAGGCMAMVPLGVHAAQGEEVNYDPAHWTDRGKAVASGALIWGGLKLFGCSNSLSTRRPSRLGLLLGAGLAAGVVLTQMGLCQATPYCWALQQQQ